MPLCGREYRQWDIFHVRNNSDTQVLNIVGSRHWRTHSEDTFQATCRYSRSFSFELFRLPAHSIAVHVCSRCEFTETEVGCLRGLSVLNASAELQFCGIIVSENWWVQSTWKYLVSMVCYLLLPYASTSIGGGRRACSLGASIRTLFEKLACMPPFSEVPQAMADGAFTCDLSESVSATDDNRRAKELEGVFGCLKWE